MTRVVLVTLLTTCASMVGLHAQAATEVQDVPPVFLLDANYAKPLRSNVGGSLFLSNDFGREGGSGVIVGGSVGRGGMQAWVGQALIGNVGGGIFAPWSFEHGITHVARPPTLPI